MNKLKALTQYRVKLPANKQEQEYWKDQGLLQGDIAVCLGEIRNMPSHYVIAIKNGKVLSGLHADLFEEI